MHYTLFLSAQTHGTARILRVPVKNVSERLNLQSHFLYHFPIFQLASLLPGLIQVFICVIYVLRINAF